ncbi:MAG: L-threonine 3-dehydrogenase [Calditrichaeota bacterium]|nr:MAG: L-threonine 3-dehydrogenase [Calditrichota bacterium]
MGKTMRALAKVEAGPGFKMIEAPVPEIGPREVLVKVKATSICGTDLHIFHWNPWAAGRIKPPLIVGHECAGEVVQIGNEVTAVRKGDLVSLESHVVCGVCDMCRTGQGHLCRNTKILGVDRDGVFAEYVAVPEINAWPDPGNMAPEIASLQENFGNAVHTAFSADVRSKKVLVTGCGPVGIMTIAVAKAIGARAVYATDVSDYRLKLAKKMGADFVINASDGRVVETIREISGSEDIDVLLEMSGSPSALIDGFTLLKPGGEAALLGLQGRPIEFDLENLVIFKGLTVRGVIGRKLWETWYQGRGLLRSGAVDLSPMVTHKFPLEQYKQAFELMESGQCGKVVLLP